MHGIRRFGRTVWTANSWDKMRIGGLDLIVHVSDYFLRSLSIKNAFAVAYAVDFDLPGISK